MLIRRTNRRLFDIAGVLAAMAGLTACDGITTSARLVALPPACRKPAGAGAPARPSSAGAPAGPASAGSPRARDAAPVVSCLRAAGSVASGARASAAARAYRFILPRSLDSRRRWGVLLKAKHHDYPAIDIPVPAGTPYFAITGGTVAYTQPGNPCGRGLALFGLDGVLYVYCHGSKRLVQDGTPVSPGQEIGLTGKTGDATGPHLHFQLSYGGVLRCPQPLLWSLDTGSRPGPDALTVRSLPTTGCVAPEKGGRAPVRRRRAGGPSTVAGVSGVRERSGSSIRTPSRPR